jgi:hypothetical protein
MGKWREEDVEGQGRGSYRTWEEDMSVMQVGRWWEKVQSKEEWRRIVGEAKAHSGL